MVILRKLFGLVALSLSILISQDNNCFAKSPLSMEIRQAEIAKNVTDAFNYSLEIYSPEPRIRIEVELINNGVDTVLFYGHRGPDNYSIEFQYKGEQFNNRADIYLGENRGDNYLTIPPGEALIVPLVFHLDFLDADHPLIESGYSQILWDILPTITITYIRNEKIYGVKESITASWGNWDNIAITKVPEDEME